MKAAIVTAPGVIEIQDIPEPEPGPYQALVKILATGFCNGTDAKIIEGHWPGVGPFPYILGHETVGRIVQLGEKVRNLDEGEVILQAHVDAYPQLGLGSAWGGFTEYGLVTDWQALEEDGLPIANEFDKAQQTIPGDIDPLPAVMFITYKETYSALQHFGVPRGRPVVVVGDGPVGVCLGIFARQLGGDPVIVAGHHDSRLKRAQLAGIDHVINSKKNDFDSAVRDLCPQGVALFIDGVGSNAIVQQGLNLLQDGGRVAIYGYTDTRQATFDWSAAPMRWTMDYLVVPQLDRVVESHDAIVELAVSGVINPTLMISDTLVLEDVDEAYRRVKDREAFKAVIVTDR